MKYGRSLQDLAVEIQRQQDNKRDFLVPIKKVFPIAHNNRMELTFPINERETDIFVGPLTSNGHIQLGQYCDIPKKYYDAMLPYPTLLAENVSHWLKRSDDKRMVRSLDGNVRAILSDSYRRLDNYDLAQNVLPMLLEADAKVESCEITDKKLYIKAITHKTQAEITKGDVVSAGLIISNSETGHGSLSVKPLVYRLVCSNGMIAEDYAMRKYHAGRTNELEQIEFSNDTLLAEDKAFWFKVRDLVKHTLNETTFDKIVNSMREASQRTIVDSEKAIEMVSKKHLLNETEQKNVLNHLIQGADLSSWGLANAVTRTAQDVESYDRSVELESIGYHIMNQSWN